MSGFTLPTSRRITQPYGAEFDDWDGDGDVDYPGGFYNSIGWDGHNGIDYGCGLGDPIEAVADGYVSFAAWAGNHWLLSGGGNAILIEHREHGVQTEYLHLSRFAVAAGQWVKVGQVIGYGGKTGAATGYHLHLGMLPLKGININNRMRGRIDPTPYLYGGLAAQGTITPTQQEEPVAFNAEQEKFIIEALTSLVKNVATKKDVASPGQVAFTEAALRSLVENVATKADLAGVTAAVAAAGASASPEEITAAVQAGLTAGLTITVKAGE